MPPKIHPRTQIGCQRRVLVLHRSDTVIALPSLLIPEAESGVPSSVAEAVRRGG